MPETRIIYPPLADLDSLRQPLTEGERRVFEFFHKYLAPEWEIYLQPHLNGLRPDFVLLNPQVGVAVFEIKDWNLDAMHYFVQSKNGREPKLMGQNQTGTFSLEKQNPVTKVRRYKQALYEIYCPRLESKLGFACITAGVIFPNAPTRRVQELFKPFLEKFARSRKQRYPNQDAEEFLAKYQPVAGGDFLAAGNLCAVFPESMRRNSKYFSESMAKDLRGWLVEPDFAFEQRQPLPLDANQRRLVETWPKSGFRRLRGPAGSGKTNVLAARAALLANQGKSVLIISFNITLWHYIRDMVRRNLVQKHASEQIVFSHFHLWCRDICRDVDENAYDSLWHTDELEQRIHSLPEAEKEKIRQESIEEILNVRLPVLTQQCLPKAEDFRYDAILVDEGQDLLPLWWETLRKALNPDGQMLLVADTTQDIYERNASWTEEAMNGAGFAGGRWAQLSVSYRLPMQLIKLARDYALSYLPPNSIDLPEPDLSQGELYAEPCDLRWHQAGEANALSLCCEELNHLMTNSGSASIANADITLLAPDLQSGAAVIRQIEASFKLNLLHTFGPDSKRKKLEFFLGDARIKATTMHSFKGWESRCLLVYIPATTNELYLPLIYIALTRIKRHPEGAWLSVVCAEPKLKDFGQQFGFFKDSELPATTLRLEAAR